MRSQPVYNFKRLHLLPRLQFLPVFFGFGLLGLVASALVTDPAAEIALEFSGWVLMLSTILTGLVLYGIMTHPLKTADPISDFAEAQMSTCHYCGSPDALTFDVISETHHIVDDSGAQQTLTRARVQDRCQVCGHTIGEPYGIEYLEVEEPEPTPSAAPEAPPTLAHLPI